MNIQSEEKVLQVKKEQLLITTKFLDEEFLTLVDKADKEQNLLLILKATSKKRKSKEKRAKIKCIDEAHEVLAKKRKKSKMICHNIVPL